MGDVIYLAGKYRDTSLYQVKQNIRLAESVAIELWKNGDYVISPHKNTAFLDGSISLNDSEIWLLGDLKILERCDKIMVLPNWRDSRGTLREIDHALANCIPVHFWDNSGSIVEYLELMDKSPNQYPNLNV